MSLSLLRIGKLASIMKFDVAARTLVAATSSSKRVTSPPKAPKSPKQAKAPKLKPEPEQLAVINEKDLLTLLSKPVIRPPSGFNLYVKEQYDDLRRNSPQLSPSQVMKSLSEKWSTMDPNNKGSYLDAAKAQRSQDGPAYSEYRNILSQKVKVSAMLKSIRKAGLTKRIPRGCSGFNLFCRENYPSASGDSLASKMKFLASQWSRTPESLKLEYNDRASKLHQSKNE